MPNEFVIKNGFISKGNSIVEGGFTATTISASTYSNLPSPSITVGTSQLTSGTDTRVLFQSGTTLQQDGNFTFDPTLKRLTLRAVGTSATDIPFAVQNSGGGSNLFTVRGDQGIEMIASTPSTNGGILITKTDTYNSPRIQLYNVFSQLTDINGSTITTSNVKAGNSGAAGFIGFVTPVSQDRYLKFINLFGQETLSIGGNNYDGAATFTLKSWAGTSPGNIFTIIKSDNTNPFVITDTARVGVGTNSPQSRLDVRAQGALSTDIAFRVRNSTDTQNLMSLAGNGNLTFNNTTLGTNYLTIGQGGANSALDCFIDNGAGPAIRFNNGIVQNGINLTFNTTSRVSGVYISTTRSIGDATIFFDGGQNIRIGQGFSNTNQPDANATRTIQQMNGVAPTTSVADGFQQYSADITAGNAAPHFRTENGSIVKLYQNANTVAIDDNLINLGVRASGGTSTFTNPVSVGSFSATTGTINGNLTITGDTTMPNRSAFSVYGAGTTNNLTTTQNGDGTLNTNNFGLTYSQGTGFDISTGIFTAPIAGLYQVTLIGRNSGFAGGISQLAVIRNNSNASGNVMMIEWAASSSMNHTGGAQIFKLAVGDTLRLKVLAGEINFDGNDNWSVAYIG